MNMRKIQPSESLTERLPSGQASHGAKAAHMRNDGATCSRCRGPFIEIDYYGGKRSSAALSKIAP